MESLTSAWGSVVRSYDPYAIDFFGSILVQLVFWWLPCLTYISLEYIAPAFSERHKIQPAPKQPTWADIRHAAAVSIRNQALVTALHGAATVASRAQGRPPALLVSASLPSATTFARDFAVSCAVREVLFYYAHRLFHVRALYRRVHKTHHRFTAPVALSSQYAHPLEHVLANVLPVILPPLLLNAHVLTAWAFLAWQLLETATVHSGYDFFGGAARKHDRHHEAFNVYFGGMGVLDWLHGTDERDKAHKKRE